MRLDRKVAELVPEISRASASKLIASGKVRVNGALATKASQSLAANDKIEISYQASEPPLIDLPIIYEDKNCVVIDKPAGVLTHSKGAFNPEATVASWLKDKFGSRSDTKAPGLRAMQGADEQRNEPYTKYGERAAQPATQQRAKSNSRVGGSAGEQAVAAWWLSERAGIVHRLDRATSGVMICAKDASSHKFLQKQFSTRKVRKTYYAVVAGCPEPAEAIIDMPIERNPKAPATFRAGSKGKPAQTHYKIIKTSDNYSLLELKPTTGRTHQLRVHFKQIGHPIIGDTLYGGEAASRLMLHASELEITLPGGARKIFKAKLPPEISRMVE